MTRPGEETPEIPAIEEIPGIEGVEAARERFVDEVEGVRDELREKVGWAPRGARWILPAVAVAAGVAAGGILRRRLRRLRER